MPPDRRRIPFPATFGFISYFCQEIEDKVDSLKAEKDAALMITNGDPLSQEIAVKQAYIQGRKIDMRDKLKQLYTKHLEKYQQLLDQ